MGVDGNYAHASPGRRGRAVGRLSVSLGVLVILLSSLWVGMVDVAGRLQRQAWESEGIPEARPLPDGPGRAMAWRVDEGWFRLLVTTDPTMALRAAERCVVVWEQPADCKPLFERALSGNGRLSAAALGLADLAEQGGDLEQAEEIYRQWGPADRSFAFLWSYWNFCLRAGDHTGFRDMGLTVAEKAPVQFRGDFPLLALAGIPAEQIVQRLSERGSWERAFAYAGYLYSVDDPAAGGLAASLLRKFAEAGPGGVTAATGLRREQGRAWTERLVWDNLSRRRGYAAAAEVWRAAVDVGFLPDRRIYRKEDAALNPNPRFQQPFLNRGFDWSFSDRVLVEALREDSAPGVRISGKQGVRDGTVLLSKLVTLPADCRAVRVRVEQAGCDGAPFCGDFEWEAFDAASGRPVGTAAAVPPLRDGKASGSYSVLLGDLQTASGEPREAIYAGLVCRRCSAGADRVFELQLREVRFETVGVR